jgi:A/G-specific adenine glycosylase
LRAWYRRHARDLPWRNTRDPYAILVSELMLQQTQVLRVVPRWHTFLAQFPTLQHVAEANVGQVEAAWEGLGYYARARNLHRTARLVTRDGADANAALPADASSLAALPGIGRYTAGAISSFAYGRRAPIVDTNVARVLQRVFLPRARRKVATTERALWLLAERSLPRHGAAVWTHNQALMEIGALVCTARVMHCERCPVRSVCATYAAQTKDTQTARRRRRT